MNKSLSNDLKIFAKNLNVLIVEDEIDLGNELHALLALFFNKVYNARDGEEGLMFFKKYKCDIVITDLNMPKMNGVELSKQIRIIDKNQVIMVLSGYIDTFVVDLIDIGIQSLMLKPYKIEDFIQKLLVQCENIVLKKEFEKMRLNKTLSNYSKLDNDLSNEVSEDIPFQIFEEKEEQYKEKSFVNIVNNASYSDVENSLNEYIINFNIDSKLDTNMWKIVSADILNLNEHYEDIINKIMLHGYTDEINYELSKIFSRYNQSLILLPGLEKFADIFLDLGNSLKRIDFNNIELDTNNDLFEIFEYFYDNIIKSFNVIFINKEIKNLDYLIDSLQRNVKELKIRLGLINIEKDE